MLPALCELLLQFDHPKFLNLMYSFTSKVYLEYGCASVTEIQNLAMLSENSAKVILPNRQKLRNFMNQEKVL